MEGKKTGTFKTWKGKKQESLRPGRGKTGIFKTCKEKNPGIFKTWKGKKQESLRPGRGKSRNL